MGGVGGGACFQIAGYCVVAQIKLINNDNSAVRATWVFIVSLTLANKRP